MMGRLLCPSGKRVRRPLQRRKVVHNAAAIQAMAVDTVVVEIAVGVTAVGNIEESLAALHLNKS
jgi:hypothetical protein